MTNLGIAKKLWNEMFQQIGPIISQDMYAADNVFDSVIVKHYEEPHRKYHNLNHIIYCLNLFDKIKELDLAIFPEEITLAIWFHDLVYNTKDNNNEIQSAKIAENILSDLGYPLIRIENVIEMIKNTNHFNDKSVNFDTRILLDIDIAILGDNTNYDAYERAIREEYNWVTEEKYKIARKSILQSFLNKERIYFLNYFHNNIEGTARKNLEQTIKTL